MHYKYIIKMHKRVVIKYKWELFQCGRIAEGHDFLVHIFIYCLNCYNEYILFIYSDKYNIITSSR